MNAKQVAWAKLHDWFRCAVMTVDGFVVIGECSWVNVDTREQGVEVASFTSFSELKAWAGY